MLSGIRVLIVEDESLVAATLSDAVEEAGGEVVGIASSVSEARRLIRMLAFHVAVLDLSLADGEVTPVLEALHACKAPTVIYSGGDLPSKVRERHPELVALRKPALPGRIVAEILRAPERGVIARLTNTVERQTTPFDEQASAKLRRLGLRLGAGTQQPLSMRAA